MEWTREHNKVYASKHDEEAAYKTYLENVEHVRVLNEQYKSRYFTQALNHKCIIVTTYIQKRGV